MEAIGKIRNIKVYDSSLFRLEEIEEKYSEYIKKLMELDPKKLKIFIQHIKNREIINNQEAEMEEPFLMELYKLTQKRDSIDKAMDYFKDDVLTKSEVRKLHEIVIKGTKDDSIENYDFRKDNNKWVGSYDVNGNVRIDYMPPDYKNISELLDIVLDYLNENNYDLNNLFIKPLVVHALLAYIQPFGNGNTRLSRVIQHCKICKITNDIFKTSFTHPTFYLSKNYLLTRQQYRGLIQNIAVSKDDDAWNKWFKYNFNMIDEQLFYLDKQLTIYKNNM